MEEHMTQLSVTSADYYIRQLDSVLSNVIQSLSQGEIKVAEFAKLYTDGKSILFSIEGRELSSLVRKVADERNEMLLEIIFYFEEVGYRYEVSRFNLSVYAELISENGVAIADLSSRRRFFEEIAHKTALRCLSSPMFKPFPRIESPQKP